MNKAIYWTEFKIEFCAALLLLSSLTVFSQDNQKIIIGGKAFDKAQIHVYPNSIPEFKVDFPDPIQKISKVETIGTLKEENFIVTTWIQTETDGLHYALIHHKIPPIIENEIKNSTKKTRDFLKTTATKSLSAYGAIDVKVKRHDYKNILGFELTCRSDFSDLLLVKCRICKVDNNLFFIIAADKESDSNSIDQFIKSFRLLT